MGLAGARSGRRRRRLPGRAWRHDLPLGLGRRRRRRPRGCGRAVLSNRAVPPAANGAAGHCREHGGGDRAGHLPRRGPPRLRRDLRRDLASRPRRDLRRDLRRDRRVAVARRSGSHGCGQRFRQQVRQRRRQGFGLGQGVWQQGWQRRRSGGERRRRRLRDDLGDVAGRHDRGRRPVWSPAGARRRRDQAGWNGASAAANALSDGIVKRAFCSAARSTTDTRPSGIPDAVSTRPSRSPSSAATSGRGGSSPARASPLRRRAARRGWRPAVPGWAGPFAAIARAGR